MKKILAVILAISLLCVGLVACGNEDKSYLVVADNAFAPFDYLDPDTGKYTGVDMDILAAIAEDQGFKYTVDNCGWDAALGNLASGQADGMIAGMTITDKRKETYDFSDGYFTDGQILIVKTDSAVTSTADLNGKSVAVKAKTQSASYANSIAAECGFTVHEYENSAAVYAAINNGTDEAGFDDYSVVKYAIKTNNLPLKTLGEVVNQGQYGFAVNKGKNAELIEMFNKGLKNIKDNGKYDEILAKYGITE